MHPFQNNMHWVLTRLSLWMLEKADLNAWKYLSHKLRTINYLYWRKPETTQYFATGSLALRMMSRHVAALTTNLHKWYCGYSKAFTHYSKRLLRHRLLVRYLWKIHLLTISIAATCVSVSTNSARTRREMVTKSTSYATEKDDHLLSAQKKTLQSYSVEQSSASVCGKHRWPRCDRQTQGNSDRAEVSCSPHEHYFQQW